MWPEAVERVAILVRAAGIEGRLEELLPDAEPPPGLCLDAAAFDCAGRPVVALFPAGREVDPAKLARLADCPAPRPGRLPAFPYAEAAVFLEHTACTVATVWLEAGSPNHLLGVSPGQLSSLTRAVGADLLRESRKGGG